ncbi:adenylate/guanylate cyclase domain-containing protein [Lutimonas vermicola]|uniref:Adenylate/guanylate cyclase domain-containing protein n=1 Tax=Lutimonas vermicola TaxID=414288 RepID=A0ABU9L1M7_9FLAO
MGFFLIISYSNFAQNQSLADSLELIFKKGDFDEKDRLNILEVLAQNHTVYEKRIEFIDELIEFSKDLDANDYLWSGYLEKGNVLTKNGDLSLALESYLKAADIAIEIKENNLLGSTYTAIAGAYYNAHNHQNTVYYYQKAIEIFRQAKTLDSLNFAKTNLNLGDEYLRVNQPDSALVYFLQSEPIFKSLQNEAGEAYNLGNIGIAYAQKGRHDLAESYMNDAIVIHKALQDYYPICQYLLIKADIYIAKGDYETASNFAHESLVLATEKGLKKQISEANLKLSDIYNLVGNTSDSYQYYKDHIAYRDSVFNLTSLQKMADMRTNFEVAKKQSEVDLLNQQKTNQKVLIFTMVVIFVMTGLYYWNISKEKKRSDKLLLNILPAKTAEELKKSGKVQAKKFDSVSVMFTDFQAFTRYSQQLSPEVLVKSVDYFFSKFDKIIDTYKLEKIKTIGDAYMCAGGLPNPSDDHAVKIIQAAFEIQQFVTASKQLPDLNIAHFEIRIGINTGPVVAGVVGKKKFAYDIWGDTVNVAARMESNSMAGMINISENTFKLVEKYFDCEYRGEIDVKNKGMMKMYFVLGPKNLSKIKKQTGDKIVLC